MLSPRYESPERGLITAFLKGKGHALDLVKEI